MAITKNGSTFTGLTAGLFDVKWTSASFAIAASTHGILVVSIGVWTAGGIANPTVVGVKWGGSGGTALTKVTSQVYDPAGTAVEEASIWYLVAPIAQTSTLYVDFGATYVNEIAVAATVWDGAAQTTPFSGASSFNSGWTNSWSVTVSSATSSLVIDAIIDGGAALTCSQTQDANISNTNTKVGQSNKAGASSVVMNWTSANTNGVMVAASLAPYVDASHINMALAVGGS